MAGHSFLMKAGECVKGFLRSPAGQGTLAVYAAGLLLAWPPALSFLVALILFGVAARQFCESFRSLDEQAADPPQADPADMAPAASRCLAPPGDS
jgi:hypothetical protein